MKMKNTYFGFTNNLKPMQKAKQEKSLDMLIRYNGKVMTEKEFVYMKLEEGYTPNFEENYSYYSRRLDDMTKPKTLYILELGNKYQETNKTIYNYCLHLLENDFLNEDKASTFIVNEIKENEEAERLEQERIQKEREEAEAKRQIEKEQQDKIRLEKIAKWTEIGDRLMTNEAKNTITEVVSNHWEKIIESYPESIKNELINNYIKNLPQYLGNVEYIKSQLQYLVHDNDINFTNIRLNIEKDIYMNIFNVLETDSKHTITAKVKAHFENREYKGAGQTKPVEYDTFYYYNQIEKAFMETVGEKLKIKGIECFLHELNGIYSINEISSGVAIQTGSNKTEVKKKTREAIEKHGIDKINELIQQRIRVTGVSPKLQAV